MSTQRTWAVRCDRCGYREYTGRPTAAGARRAVADHGWTRPRLLRTGTRITGDWCSTCSAPDYARGEETT